MERGVLFGILLPKTDSDDDCCFQYEEDWYRPFAKQCKTLGLEHLFECSLDKDNEDGRLFVGLVLNFQETSFRFEPCLFNWTLFDIVRKKLLQLRPLLDTVKTWREPINWKPTLWMVQTSELYGGRLGPESE